MDSALPGESVFLATEVLSFWASSWDGRGEGTGGRAGQGTWGYLPSPPHCKVPPAHCPAPHLPHWGKGNRSGRRRPGRRGTALRARGNGMPNEAPQGWSLLPATPPPPPQDHGLDLCQAPGGSPGGVGRLLAFTMNSSMSFPLSSGKILVSGWEGKPGRSGRVSPCLQPVPARGGRTRGQPGPPFLMGDISAWLGVGVDGQGDLVFL